MGSSATEGGRDVPTRRGARRVLGLAILGVLLGLPPCCAAASGADSNSASDSAAGPAKLTYNRDVRPILSENCFACHGPDKNQRKGKLRLDVREAALEKKAIVPGRPAESELVRRIETTNADDQMPPPESHKTLSADQKERLKRWIAEGGEYQPHWAYIPPARPEVPAVRNRAWGRNAVDAFILRALEQRGIEPSAEADRRTLLRRLSLDLVGLPPTPAETAAFLADSSPQAYERQVDRLLGSPHYGERMAVPWLDVVRFSDTVGYHGDQNVNVFPYRDYVIDAFNRNKPFDRFTVEQIAGDLVPHPGAEQLVATAFNRLNMVTREGGAQPEEYLAKYGADRVRTVSMTWLGSTMGCCECHDHKYDPFSTKDFYSMKAFFADLRQWGVYNDYNYTPNPDLKGWSNDHPFPPEITVASPYLRQRMDRLERRIDERVKASRERLEADGSRRKAFTQWRRAAAAFLKGAPEGWVVPEATPVLANNDTNAPLNAAVSVAGDGSLFFTGEPTDSTRVDLDLDPATAGGWLAAIRLELIPDERHGDRILRGTNLSTTVTLSASLKRSGAESPERLAFYFADADRKEERYVNGFAVLGVKDGWRVVRDELRSPHTAVWLVDKPVRLNAGDRLRLTLGRHAAGRIRVSLSPFAAQNPLQAGDGPRLSEDLSRSDRAARDRVDRTYLLSTAWDEAAFAGCRKLGREIMDCRDGLSPVVVSMSWTPALTRVLPRGNWQDESGEIVQPAVPHFLPQPPNPDGRRLTRLDLARWLVARDNPLTARTFVNRLWKQFFGTGISAVVDDLGAQGDWPVHPDLLDWLAVEFMESGWDVKHMVKLMVMSAAYRQTSNPRPEIRELDPNNRLLASQSPRRLEAEFVRDNALSIAGLLNQDIGGPSAHPYQPAGYYVNLQFPDRDYVADLDESQYRRGVYTHWQRTFLHPMLANFDAPSREECIAGRNVSNTPQQALTLLDDPSFVEAARVFAAYLLSASAPSDAARLKRAYERALARPIRPEEERSLEQFLALQREHYRSDPEEARRLLRVGLAPEPAAAPEPELAAWTQVCRVVLNLHETITRY